MMVELMSGTAMTWVTMMAEVTSWMMVAVTIMSTIWVAAVVEGI